MSPLVVHCKHSPYDIYIGRPSKWGNPFIIGQDGNRAQVVAKFEKYLITSSLIKDIQELKGKVLGCWCRPYCPCHGDILVKYTCK